MQHTHDYEIALIVHYYIKINIICIDGTYNLNLVIYYYYLVILVMDSLFTYDFQKMRENGKRTHAHTHTLQKIF